MAKRIRTFEHHTHVIAENLITKPSALMRLCNQSAAAALVLCSCVVLRPEKTAAMLAGVFFFFTVHFLSTGVSLLGNSSHI